MADDLKARIREASAALFPRLVEVSERMHANPEIGFQEEKAAGWLTALLEEHGFAVERGTAGLPTAFIGSYGKGGPVIAFLSEYDALPEVGHGCGHNLIGPSAIGAGICAKVAADALGGTIKVYGTPAEEVGGGKPVMVDQGLFGGIDAVMMFHPYPGDLNSAATGGGSLALRVLDVTYRGKGAHSAFAPWEGRNALDGVIQLFNALNAMRQQLKPDVRLHGIITNGGQAFNVTPEIASARIGVRSFDTKYLQEVVGRIEAAARGAADATGTQVELATFMRYDAMKPNSSIGKVLRENLRGLGMTVPDPRPTPPERAASSDFGNVSQVAPAAGFAVATHEPGTNFHTHEFTRGATGTRAFEGMRIAVEAMACSAADLLAAPELVAQARREFESA
jgi:amidohydrolase